MMVSYRHVQYQKKTNDPILRKLSDEWTDRRTDGQTDWSDFIGHCPTNVECPKDILILRKGSTGRLDDIKITAAAKDSINFTKQQNNFA